jgi:hypothetical protein
LFGVRGSTRKAFVASAIATGLRRASAASVGRIGRVRGIGWIRWIRWIRWIGRVWGIRHSTLPWMISP